MNKHWSMLQQRYQQTATWVDRIALHERVLLLIVLIAVIYVLWVMLLMSPECEAIDLARFKEAALVKQITESQQKIARIEKDATMLLTNTQPLNSTPGNITVADSTVISMLKSLLKKQQGIALKGLYNLPDQPINDAALKKLPLPLYKQKVYMIFNSNYLSTYEYLQSVENLEWMIFWDELQYVVTEHPNAEIRLTAYTIGPNKKCKEYQCV